MREMFGIKDQLEIIVNIFTMNFGILHLESIQF